MVAGATATDSGASRCGRRSPLCHAEGWDGRRDEVPLRIRRWVIRRSDVPRRLHERELLHHARMIFVASGLIGGHLLDQGVKNGSVGVVRCGGLR